MFLRSTTRKKNGKEHKYFSIVENKRVASGRVVQRHVLYLGEINDTRQEAWRRTIEIFEEGQPRPKTVALFPEERIDPIPDEEIVRIRLKDLQLRRPRQWGGCWLSAEIYEQLGLDRFWQERLTPSRKGTRWDLVLRTLVTYRLLDPGSEWRLHRQWFQSSAMGDLLGEDFELAEIHKLYECLDLLLEYKKGLFDHLTKRWKDLFNASYEVLLYDLTSSYFESSPPFAQEDKRKFGHSRDKRSDCVQVVIGLVVTPEGFPLAYEVLAGNTSDKKTLGDFLQKIEAQYGKAQRIWVMDRGIPTEKFLAQMRASDPPVHYLVGTPKGRLSRLENKLTELSWKDVRDGIEVKLLAQEQEIYVLARSRDRVSKERGMRRRQLKRLWKRLKELQQMKLARRDQLLMKLGAARQQAPAAWRLVEIKVAKRGATFKFALRKNKLREVRRREGHYLLRSNLCATNQEKLWELYIQLTQVEEAFKNLKGDLALRPFHHQKEDRIEAHIFVAFLAYCLHVTLGRRLKDLAPGLTPRSVLEKFSAMQMIDVHLPTTDGREVILSRYTQPEKDQEMLLHELKMQLPEQPPPKIRPLRQGAA
jgi:transposase